MSFVSENRGHGRQFSCFRVPIQGTHIIYHTGRDYYSCIYHRLEQQHSKLAFAGGVL